VGREQAIQLADRLREERIDEVLASDLRRAVETAAAVCEPQRLHFRCDTRLRELNFGAWEGLTYNEVRRSYGDALTDWEGDPLRVAPPNGETVAQLASRVEAVFKELSISGRNTTTVLFVAHRGSIGVLLCLALKMSPAARWQFLLEPASLSVLELHAKGAVLTGLNDTHHLREAAYAG
jgi:broad specificity phosphatase PhoE